MNRWRGWSDSSRRRRARKLRAANAAWKLLLSIPMLRFRRRCGTLIQSQWRNIFRHRSRSLWLFTRPTHDGRAWRHLSSQLEVVQVPGGHRGCLTIGAELLVDHLRQRIDVLADGAPRSMNRTRRLACTKGCGRARPARAGSQLSAAMPSNNDRGCRFLKQQN